MKNIKYLTLLIILMVGLASCEDDNYPQPSETFRGSFIDVETKEPFQTAVGNSGIRFTMMEYSWSDNPTPYYFYAMMDGTFNNTKLFKGKYGVKPEGHLFLLKRKC